MKQLTAEIKNDIRNMVYDYLSEECEVEKEEISDNTLVMDDLDGDSLMFVELIEIMKSKYDLNIQMQTIGKYLLKHPAKTVLEVIDTCENVYLKEDKIVEIAKV